MLTRIATPVPETIEGDEELTATEAETVAVIEVALNAVLVAVSTIRLGRHPHLDAYLVLALTQPSPLPTLHTTNLRRVAPLAHLLDFMILGDRTRIAHRHLPTGILNPPDPSKEIPRAFGEPTLHRDPRQNDKEHAVLHLVGRGHNFLHEVLRSANTVTDATVAPASRTEAVDSPDAVAPEEDLLVWVVIIDVERTTAVLTFQDQIDQGHPYVAEDTIHPPTDAPRHPMVMVMVKENQDTDRAQHLVTLGGLSYREHPHILPAPEVTRQ